MRNGSPLDISTEDDKIMSQDLGTLPAGEGKLKLTTLVGGSSVGNLSPKLNLRRLETIQRLLQVGAIVTLLIFVGLIVFSWLQLRRINREIAGAEALLAKRKLELEESERKISDLRAKYGASRNLNDTLSGLTRDATERDPGQAENIKRSIEESISLTANPNQIPARIYLQVGREDQRRRASEVALQLQTKGYVVPGLEQKRGGGVENVRGRNPHDSEIRFYQNDEISQKDVNDIINAVREMGLTLKAKQLTPSRHVRPRHYEIWIGDDF